VRRAKRVAVVKWVPLAAARKSFGDATLVRATKVKSRSLDLDAPDPVFVGLMAVSTPKVQSSTSIVLGGERLPI